jgi:predicted SAM-dependent methyltransferase
MNIEFGCGETPSKPGYKTCDIRNLPGIDFVCAAWEIDKLVGHETVDHVYSRHFLEHLTFRQVDLMLKAWLKILKPGGKCEIIVPNMAFHIKQWQQRNSEQEFRHAQAGFWGWQRGDIDSVWDIHKSGYDLESIRELLTAKGFIDFRSLLGVDSWHLHVTCLRPQKENIA